MDSQSGLNQKRNAEALVKRYGPESLVKGGGACFGAPNLTPLSPYGPRMWSAAYDGNLNEVVDVAKEAMEVVKSIGKPDPRGAVEELFARGNFMHNATSQLPTKSQYDSMIAKMSAAEAAELKTAQEDFTRAAEWLGFPRPNFYKDDEKEWRSRHQSPIGRRSLRRY